MIQSVATEIGIVAIQKFVSQPFMRRVTTGCPWIEIQWTSRSPNASSPLASWNRS
jgi:hypothetical protein